MFILICQWECKVVQMLWWNIQQYLTKVNVYLPFESTIPLLGISQLDILGKNICTNLFSEALFVITTCSKQPKMPTFGR